MVLSSLVMRRIALITFGAVLIALNAFWLLQIVPDLPYDWPRACIAAALTWIGIALVYNGARPSPSTPSETSIRTIRWLDRYGPLCLFVLFVAVFTYLVFVHSAA